MSNFSVSPKNVHGCMGCMVSHMGRLGILLSCVQYVEWVCRSLGLGSSMSHATVRMFTKSTGLLGGERGTWIHGEAHGVLLC